ncbi:MAG: hypothetical protein ABJA93_01990 [Sporichthyaceae bacterium]
MDTFEWTTHPEAEALVDGLVTEAIEASRQVRILADRLATETSTRLVDWLDHVAAPTSPEALTAAGFAEQVDGVWRHPSAQLPAVVPLSGSGLALRVDDAAAFAAAHGGAGVDGAPLSGLRRAVVSGPDAPVWVAGVERRSWTSGVTPEETSDDRVAAGVRARALWAERPRGFDVDSGLGEAASRAARLVELVGVDLAASHAMEVERAFWQRRNSAAVVQHARQDRLGLGWGNNDHHTFRSSRSAFRSLLDVLQALGFSLRERFHAGAEAGWGAQVLEQPGAGLVVFADVDLEPAEFDVDFAQADLTETQRLGTVGLWCALHGESMLAAGMHHLEGQFDFDRLREDLAGRGIAHMAPFSDFPHLRQAFTIAERWPVARERLDVLVAAGLLEPGQAEEFAVRGAAGSHLENLARRGGFKGFNQRNVSTTMRATDPRVLR